MSRIYKIIMISKIRVFDNLGRRGMPEPHRCIGGLILVNLVKRDNQENLIVLTGVPV